MVIAGKLFLESVFSRCNFKMNNNVKNMFGMIAKALDREWSVQDFRQGFYDYYLEDVPDEDMSRSEREFFNAIQEKLDWVDENPDDESRGFCWIDNIQFLNWLSEHIVIFNQR